MRRWTDDPFTKKARRENFEARSIYKLEEIDKRERVLSGALTVLDLGAAPGSWAQYCLKNLPKDRGKVIAVDIAPINVTDSRLHFFQKPIEEMNFTKVLAGEPADLVLSDMAPKTSGIHDRDVQLSFELASLALETAKTCLRPRGHFVVKLFMGDCFDEYHQHMKRHFKEVKLLRPQGTRKHSREIFFIGKYFL